MDVRKNVLCLCADGWTDMCKFGNLGIQRTVSQFPSPPGAQTRKCQYAVDWIINDISYLFALDCQQSIIGTQKSALEGQQSKINVQRSTVNGQRSTIKNQRSKINDQKSTIKNQK